MWHWPQLLPCYVLYIYMHMHIHTHICTQKSQIWTSEWGNITVKAAGTCWRKLVPHVWWLRRISWSLITNSVSVPWNNTRLAITESCHWHSQVSIHLSAFINYTSQWQIPPHSFVCSHRHGNKRIRYQRKLIYSYEDGVPTVLAEMNACSQCHQPAWQLSQWSILHVLCDFV